MDAFKLIKSNIEKLVMTLLKRYRIFAPVELDGISSFKEVTGVPSKFKYYNTKKPPKEIFFPQTETILIYKENHTYIPEHESKPAILFGVRPCDAKSFTLLDKVFDDEKYKDTYWVQKRENSVVFTLACDNPLTTCFCNWFNSGPFDKGGTDVFLVDIGDAFILEPCSTKGKEILKEVQDLLIKTTDDDLKKVQDVKNKAEERLPELVNLDTIKEKLDKLWDDPIWNEIAQKCLTCSTCAYLCPTCHCFDIQDELITDNQGKRIRIWDSCMFKLFTQEAAGTNPRPTAQERIRQRIMHKFNYFVENFKEFGCVGCGRCVRACPVNIDLREIIKQLTATNHTNNF